MPPLTKNPDTVYIGIDPGQKGGLVAIHTGQFPPIVDYTPMPETPLEVWEWFSKSVNGTNPIINYVSRVAMIEEVHAMPGQGVTSMFTFGKGYGGLIMALTASMINFETVRPQAWMKALGIPSKPKKVKGPKLKKGQKRAKGTNPQTIWKRQLKERAQRLYPRLEIWKEKNAEGKQLAIADALLIATYCLRKHTGKL